MVYLLHHLLSESAEKYPDKEAIAFKDDKLTYAELERESNKLAHGLSGIGIARGERVGIYMNRCIASIIGGFGILKAGATYVPIDPLCPPNRLSYIVNKCGIKYLLTVQDKLTNIEQVFPDHSPLESIVVMNGLDSSSRSLGSTKLIEWREIRKTASGEAPPANAIDSDVAYILFTSGSTGNPKGVMLSHLNSLTFVNSAHDFFQIKMNDRFSNICPLHFDMSVFDIFVAVKAGATVVIIPETTAIFPVKLAEIIEKNRISVWNSVPSALSLLATYKNLDSHDLSSLRLILFAGELFPLKYLRRLQEAVPGARFCNMYGQTEANSSTYYWVEKLPGDAKASLPIGRPLPNFEVFSLDEDGKPVTEPGKEGELYVRAATVALGYWGEGEKTEKSFVKNPLRPDLNERVYKTGDLVSLDPDGNYVFLGRKDHMIKSRGYRIEIGEIETVLCNHPEIKSAVVIPIPDELIGNRISVIVVPATPGKMKKEDILQYCSQQLPRYMIPESVEFRDSLPTTSSGKVDRKKLSDGDEIVSRSQSVGIEQRTF
ncbi:MAG: amino acid adenylation domain-containing protein [Thermodesulfovibrionales bacterium]|jgi:amino acid adenylation domain-containing protein